MSSENPNFGENNTIDSVVLCLVLVFLYLKLNTVYEFLCWRGVTEGILELTYGRLLRFKWVRQKIDNLYISNLKGLEHEFNKDLDYQ